MKIVVIFAFCYIALVTSSFPWVPLGVISQRGEYTFELHERYNLLLVRGTYDCYFMQVTKSLSSRLTDHGQIVQITDDILKQIRQHVGVVLTNRVRISQQYTDAMAVSECLGKHLYMLQYHHFQKQDRRRRPHF